LKLGDICWVDFPPGAGTVLVEADARNRLSKPSVALVFQLAAIDKRYVAPLRASGPRLQS